MYTFRLELSASVKWCWIEVWYSIYITQKILLETCQSPGKLIIYGLTPKNSILSGKACNFTSIPCMDKNWNSPFTPCMLLPKKVSKGTWSYSSVTNSSESKADTFRAFIQVSTSSQPAYQHLNGPSNSCTKQTTINCCKLLDIPTNHLVIRRQKKLILAISQQSEKSRAVTRERQRNNLKLGLKEANNNLNCYISKTVDYESCHIGSQGLFGATRYHRFPRIFSFRKAFS